MQRDPIPVTKDGLQALRDELDDLVNRRRPEIARILQAAREEGDLRENSGYDAAKHDQGFIEARIRELEEILRRAEVIDSNGDGLVVELGSTVTVEIDGVEETYTIVGAVEAKPTEGRISNQSPVGQALLGRRPGETVEIQTPGPLLHARIVRVDR